MSRTVDIAAAVVSLLESTDFGEHVDVRRTWAPTSDMLEVQVPLLLVLPIGPVGVNASRNSAQEDYRIDVCLLKKLNRADNDELDDLSDWCETIVDLFRRARLSGVDAICTTVENQPIFSIEDIKERRMMKSVFSLTYRCHR